MADSLTAPHVLEYDYTRSTGPVMAAFFEALAERRIVGVKTPSGKVVVPPLPWDPETSEAATEIVEVSDEGTVETWAWVADPRPNHPLDRPFAWALIKLDGADTAMLHAVDASEEQMRTGMQVRARWADEAQGSIRDIACFEVVDG